MNDDEEKKDESPYIPEEFKLLSESMGFGGGFERRHKAFAVFVISRDGHVRTSGSRTDRYFKTRRNAEEEANRVNTQNTIRYDFNLGRFVRRDPSEIREVAFAEEVEITERII